MIYIKKIRMEKLLWLSSRHLRFDESIFLIYNIPGGKFIHLIEYFTLIFYN